VLREWDEVSSSEETLLARKPCDPPIRRWVDGLEPGLAYSLRVRTSNAAGHSLWSDVGREQRMPADVPYRPKPLLSEFTNLTWIELKWFPSHDNGSPILRYDIRMTQKDTDPLEAWTIVDEETLEQGTRHYSKDGRRTIKRDTGALIYRVHDLTVATAYYFMIRCKNVVGWSDWSEVSRFVTRPSKPGQTAMLPDSCTVRHRGLEIAWSEPESNGTPVTRYDLIGGPNLRVLKWAWISTLVLGSTIDRDKDNVGVLELGEVTGTSDFDKLVCYEALGANLDSETRSFKLDDLLPAQSFYFMVRAANKVGKGEFSDILGPLTTLPESPGEIVAAEVWTVTSTTCKLGIMLPYNMGAPITQVTVALVRLEGPLSSEEIHPETGECHAHIASRTLTLDVMGLERRPPLVQEDRLRLAGYTSALRRSFEEEGLEVASLERSDHVSSMSSCTGQAYAFTLDDLRPGNRYQVTWSCCNSLGWSPSAEPASFLTEATVPDRPTAMLMIDSF